MSAVFGKYGGGDAERYVYKKLLGIDIGLNRFTGTELTPEQYD